MADRELLVVGLGNPGMKYELTRHNLGFLAMDFFAEKRGQELGNEKWQGRFCRCRLEGERVLLLKPQTFMNRSGECVARFVDFYKIEASDILVLHDDLDLVPGRVKVTAGGGAGGHNGIRSLISHLGTTAFARLKLGIGHPGRNDAEGQIPVERYVLSRFQDSERELVEEQLAVAEKAISLWIEEGIDVCMNRMNGRAGRG